MWVWLLICTIFLAAIGVIAWTVACYRCVMRELDEVEADWEPWL